MSITAFPVLSRILDERQPLETRVGKAALACASVDDVTAWCILGLAVAMVGQSANLWSIPLKLLLLALFVFLLFLLRPLIEKLLRIFRAYGTPQAPIVFAIVVAFAAGWVTERIGVHAFLAHLPQEWLFHAMSRS